MGLFPSPLTEAAIIYSRPEVMAGCNLTYKSRANNTTMELRTRVRGSRLYGHPCLPVLVIRQGSCGRLEGPFGTAQALALYRVYPCQMRLGYPWTPPP